MVEDGEIAMENKEIEQLIRFHEGGLAQYRWLMDPSSQYMEEQTINALQELKAHLGKQSIAAEAINEAKGILKKSNGNSD